MRARSLGRTHRPLRAESEALKTAAPTEKTVKRRQTLLKAEIAKWAKVVQAAGIKPE